MILLEILLERSKKVRRIVSVDRSLLLDQSAYLFSSTIIYIFVKVNTPITRSSEIFQSLIDM